MSGSNALPPIQVKIDGAQTAQQAIDGLTAAADRMGAASARTAGQVGTLRTQAEQAGGAMRNTGQIIGQAGYQVQDFAVQVASGQSALTAFIQQGSQLAGIFGPTGIMVGAGIAIAGVAAQLLMIGENAEEAKRRTEASFKGMAEAGRDVTVVLREINLLFLTASQRAAAAANAQVGTLRDDTRRLLDIAIQRNEGNAAESTQAQRDVTSTERQLAQLRGANDRAGRQVNPGLENILTTRLAEQQARLAGLAADTSRQSERIGQLNAALARLENAGIITQGGEEFGPPAPERRTGGGGGSRRDPNQFGPLDGSPQSITALERGRMQSQEREARDFDREQARREREAERAQERAVEANRRTTDAIVDYGAERFADLFEQNGRGWEGMMETFERTAKSTLARIAAEMILRPIIAPIVQGLGLGGLGGGAGGFSGITSMIGGGGGATASGGAATGGTGGIGSLLNFGGGGGGIGGLISNPIWQPGAGFFASQAAGTTAGLEALGSGVYGPAVPGGGSMLGSIGGASLGTYAAGIGGGYMIGSTLGNYIAKTDAQRTNSQIGAASGAAAGAIIGSIIPGVGTVIGGLVGGAIGGGGGGMIGPGSQFSGGDVGIGVGADGLFRVTGTGGKRWDSGAAQQQTQQQLDQINAVLRAGGVSISGVGGYDWERGTGGQTIGFAGSGQSGQVFGPTEMFARVRSGLTSSNDNMAAALRSGQVQSFEDIGNIAQWLASTFEPLSKVADYTKTFNDAIDAQNKVYDDAIARARELGLAESGLNAAREKSLSATLGARDTAVHNALQSLRIDELRATGNAGDAREASMIDFNLSSSQRLTQLQDFLRGNGYGDETSLFQSSVARLNSLFDTQRKTLAAQSGFGSGSALMEELTLGGLGGMTSAGRYAAGMKVLQDARESGNLDRITAAARSVLPVARDYLGTSERYGGLVADISRDVGRLGGDPVGLGVFLEGQAAANMTLDRIYSLNNSQLSELQRMNAEISRLNAVITTLMQRQAA